MSGFEYINHHNGWAMAIAGALIVFTGLSVLSFIISQLHKIVRFFEKKSETPTVTVTEPCVEASASDALTLDDLSDLDQIAKLYKPLVDQLEQPFALSALYQLANAENIPHPHLTIKYLRESNILVAQEADLFIWDQPKLVGT